MNTRYWVRQLFARRATRPIRRTPAHCRLRLEALEERTLLSAYVVTSAADSNVAGTLPYAIEQVNAGNYDEIDFMIPTAGVQTINLSTQLPTLTASGVYINGLSQGGPGNTTPLITLNGSGAPIFTDGLLVQGSNCTISGLTVENFGTNGIEVEGNNNVIGGSVAGAGNVIVGNAGDGVKLDSGVSGTQVLGNYIGTDVTTSLSEGNGNGVEIVSSNNTVGGLTATAGNVISGNDNDGVLIDHRASGVAVLGNYIGTNYAGTAILPNSIGIEIFGTGDTVGGTDPNAFNLISGNRADGVLIDSIGSGNQVLGNYIGTTADGTAALANRIGIELVGVGNTVGGAASGASNLISGNTGDGVLIDSTSSGNQVLGNYIGTNFDGTAALANSIGIEVAGISNTVGSASALAHSNIISGNSGDGVLIDSTANGNQVEGNAIGVNANSLGALGNSGNGIEIRGSNNTIGGNTADNQGNAIGGNKGDGVRIDRGANSNQLLYNLIGDYGRTGTLGNSIGVEIGGSNNTIASGEIVGNTGDGVLIDSSGSGNQLIANVIGNDGALDRVANSIGVEINGSNNSILANVISGNTGDGVRINRGVTGIQVSGNRIGTNDDGNVALSNNIGIEVDGFNNTIGGAAAGAGNIISGNSKDGVLLTDLGNQVLGNYIGTDIKGNSAIANGIGIELAFESNTVGAGNVISGNSGVGLKIDSGVSGVAVLGNYIGTNAAGTSALSNSIGIEIDGANNTVGGTTSGAGNLISGDNYAGVLISGSVNQVLGNSIGIALGGTSALADGTGIYVNNGSGNTIGGTTSGARNILSGNSTDGVNINGNNNQVLGNFIGTNAAGAAAVANQHNGIYVQSGSGNTIGGSSSGAGNLLSGNTANGLQITGGGSGNLVLGNSIGVNAAGTGPVANSGNGIEVDGNNNTIGGAAARARNLISGNNNGDGLLITGSDTQVLGNYIGVNAAGTAALGNSNGIVISSSGNTIGGTASGAGNLISGNSGDGLQVAVSGNLVLGNHIGVNAAGTAALGNGRNGILIGSSGNTIGGTTAGAGNLISGNSNDGVQINSGAFGNQVLGNYIGTTADGNGAVANGTGMYDYSSGNTIGGTASGAGNLISGNSGGGLVVAGGDLVLGNTIGASPFGNTSLPNSIGIVLGTNNTVGGSAAGDSNLISGNSNDGMLINGNGNQVLGNYIGTTAGAVFSLANSGNGVEVAGNNNLIGDAAAGARNFLSGNSKAGVRIDSGASGNQVVGNYVGTNADGSAALANSIGIEVAGSSNTVGGAASGAGNLISGNNTDGMLISGSANQVLGNTLGVAATGYQPLPNGTGIVLSGNGNTIGGTVSGARNVISGNTNDGVLISGGNANQVLGNYIGPDVNGDPEGNELNGIEVNGNGNTIGGTASGTGNLISSNGQGDGVKIDTGASGNQVLGNIIGDNPASDVGLFNNLGIEVAGSNNTIGGAASGAGNLIDANEHAMLISGDGNQVLGNSLLTNVAGMVVSGSGNTIGGTVSGARNVISGNQSDGVQINGSGNQVLGNYIGTTADGTGPLANSGNGIEIGGNNNTVGGTDPGAFNLISGNSKDGVLIDSSASGNQVLGNYIGTDLTGSKPLANSIGIELDGNSNTVGGTASGASNLISGDNYAGMVISGSANQVLGNSIGVALGGNAALADGTGIYVKNGSGNTIGGAALGARNFISGNSTDGMLITDGNNNQVLGNFIGTNAAGSAAVANHHNGIFVESGSGNTIGGTAGANLISGNSSDGVLITDSGNQVLGNNVGTTADGNGPLANSGNGIEIGGNNNTVGGTDPGAFNLISANSNDGVKIDSSASGNLVLGNYIGTDLRISKPLANSIGVELDGNNNTVGGTASGARNLISGNSDDGVLMDSGASGNQVLGNSIGTDFTGSNPLANSIGVELDGNSNTVGGTGSGAHNLISGNTSDGVLITGSGNQVLGNSIGVDSSGDNALANGTGIVLSGSGNTIGGAASGTGNLISGNSNDGVLITGGNNQVLGNFIGTNAAGSAAVANLQNGINVESGSGNTIGGTAAGVGNLISGNHWDGLLIASSGNLVLGNTVGATAAAAHSLSNGSNGINVTGDNNTIGGTAAGARNVISGNDKSGVRISSNFNQVLGNYIGTNGDGNGPLGNGVIGIFIDGVNNTIGGTVSGAGNLISGNSYEGVNIFGTGNQVLGNSIGISADGTAALGNSEYGVAIYNNGNNVSGGNLISDNSLGGVFVGASSDNAIRQNSVFANGPTNTGPGIILQSGANNNIQPPSLSSATLSGTTLNVKGTITAAAEFTYFLDFYANPSGDPEGKVYLGSLTVTPTSTGTQNFTFTTTTTVTGANPLITATVTDDQGSTSAFSNGVTAGSSLESSPPPSSPPPSSSSTGSSPTSNSTPTLSPGQMALEVAIDTAAFLLQSNPTAFLELEGFSEMFLGQSLPQPNDLLSTILSDLSVSGSVGLIGLQLGINFANSVKGATP